MAAEKKKRRTSTSSRSGSASSTRKKTGSTRKKPAAKTTAKTTRKKSTSTTTRTRKKTSTTNRKKNSARTVSQMRAGFQTGLLFIYRIGIVFLFIMFFGLFFLLYMAKERQIIEYADQIEQLRLEIQGLKSETSRNKAKIDKDHNQIERMAKQRLDMKNSVKPPTPFTVDKEKLEYYVRKDLEQAARQTQE